MPKKIMISQPMRGLTEEQIRANRERVVKQLTNEGWEVVDTVHQDYPTHLAENEKAIPIWYLSKSIEYMSGVDALYLMRGWSKARGCKVEHYVASLYGVEFMFEDILAG